MEFIQDQRNRKTKEAHLMGGSKGDADSEKILKARGENGISYELPLQVVKSTDRAYPNKEEDEMMCQQRMSFQLCRSMVLKWRFLIFFTGSLRSFQFYWSILPYSPNLLGLLKFVKIAHCLSTPYHH